MASNDSFDEVEFQTLWSNDLDPLTAAAASYESGDEPQPATYSCRLSFKLVFIAGLVIYVAWQLW